MGFVIGDETIKPIFEFPLVSPAQKTSFQFDQYRKRCILGDVRAAVGTHRRPGEWRRGGAALCIGSCRDLPITRSLLVKGSMPTGYRFQHAQKRSRQVSAAL